MSICPFISGTYTDGRFQLVPCQNNCELKIGNDCSFKLLGIEAFKNLHPSNISNPAKEPNTD